MKFETLQSDRVFNGKAIKVWFMGRCFRILDGEKRWRACKKLGICEMKAMIVEEMDE